MSEATCTRRTFLAGAGATAAALATGPPSAAAAAPSPPALDHEQARDLRDLDQRLADREVVDGVATLGLDSTGQQDVSGRIQEAAQNGQVVELPPGTYRFASTVRTGASGWGIRGTGDSPRDVRLRGTGRMELIDQDGGRNVTIENVTMDNGDSGEAGVGMAFNVADGLRIRNVHHIGLSPREGNTGDMEQFNEQEESLYIAITDPAGVGLVDGFVKTSPTEVSGHAENDAPFNSFAAHRGVMYVRNSTIQNAGGDGATYVSRTPGGWRFDRCSFYNNYATSLRLGGGMSWVRNSTIVIDHAADQTNLLLEGLTPGGNPIVWESASGMTDAGRNRMGGLVDNCRIELRSTQSCRGCIVVDGSHGGVVIRNTDILNNTGFRSIVAERPGSSFMNDNEIPARPHGIYLQNVTIRGSTDHGVEINGRPAAGHNVCVNGKSVSGLPASALGCGGGDASPPAWTATLLADLGNPAAANGPLPPVGGVGGLTSILQSVAVLVGGAALVVAALLVVVPALLVKWLLD